MCLDVNVGDVGSPLIMSYCHNLGGNQFFALTKNQMIVTSQEYCVGANDEMYAVVSVNCMDLDQSWTFNIKVSFYQCFRQEGRIYKLHISFD